MKKLIIALFACLPLASMAQNTWEIPETEQQQQKVRKEKKQKEEKVRQAKEIAPEDVKYIVNAVPEVDGKVVFTLDKDVPGMSADDIYQKVYEAIAGITKEENQFPTSKIAVVNKGQHTIAARLKEWLVFSASFISIDRTIFNYTLIAKASDGHINVTLERISYEYETERGTDKGMNMKAEEWITDNKSLNKSGNKLVKVNGKFRRKTIDRKDNIFGRICSALDIKY